jgi:hypothetical protein
VVSLADCWQVPEILKEGLNLRDCGQCGQLIWDLGMIHGPDAIIALEILFIYITLRDNERRQRDPANYNKRSQFSQEKKRKMAKGP